MLDPKKLLQEFLGQRVPGTTDTVRSGAEKAIQMAKNNPLATGALLSVLLGSGAGRKVTTTALRAGGMAAIAGIAYKAWQGYQAGNKPDSTPATTTPDLLLPPDGHPFSTSHAPQGEDAFSLSIIRAMIAAARSDGHIDAEVYKTIAARLKEAGLEAGSQTFLLEELESPIDLDALVASAQTDAQKLELYTASRMAISIQSGAAKDYLERLASLLDLPESLVEHVEASISQHTS